MKRSDSNWWRWLKSNLPVPVVLALLFPLGMLVESRAFGAYNQRIVMLIGFNMMLAVSLQLINGFSGQFSLGHAGFMAVGAYLAAYPAITFSSKLTDPAGCLLFFVSLAIVAGVAGTVLLSLFVLLRYTRRIHSALPGVLLVLMFCWLLADLSRAEQYEAQVAPAWLIWTRGIALAQGTFNWMIASGKPMAAGISASLPAFALAPICYLVLVIGAGCCAGAVGFVVGMPALRLRGDYLAIATLGLAEIIRIVIQNSEPLGGALGLTGIPRQTDFVWLYGGVLITILAVWRLAYSAKGRAIIAVREDEIAAAAVGIDTTHYKVLSFITGAFFAGIAGAMFSLYERSITPSYFGFQKSIEAVVIVTLGGLGSISGAILAAIVLTILPELLRGVSEYRMIIYSLLLIVMMLVRPQGLLGGIELWPRRRTRGGARGFPVNPVPTEDRHNAKKQEARA